MQPANLHLYADDTVIYTCAPSLVQAFEKLQTAFQSLQASLYGLKLVMYVQKTKLMTFTRAHTQPEKVSIVTSGGSPIEKVSSYKYLGIRLDDKLSFKVHMDNLERKLKLKLGFYFCNRACFLLMARMKLVQTTFLSVIDYGDLLYVHAPSSV